MRRQRLSLNKSVYRKYVLLLLLFMMTIASMKTFYYVDKEIEPEIRELAKGKINTIAVRAINNAVREEIANRKNLNNLIEFRYDHQGNITAAFYNQMQLSRLVASTSQRVNDAVSGMHHFENYISLGEALKSNILDEIGVQIPITYELIGKSKVDVDIKTENAGINMILWRVILKIEVLLTVITPFVETPEAIRSEIPISYALVVGRVPQLYYEYGAQSGEKGITSPLPAPSINITPTQ